MPTPVAVLSGGTRGFELGIFKNGSVAQGFNFPLSSNYRWWNGVEVLATQYLIYTDKYTMGSSNLADTIPVAWATPDLTDQSLINLINTLPPRVGLPSFTSLQPALDWLQGTNDFYLVKNGLENIVTTNLEVYWDAGLYGSYVGTGTQWTDLSGNNRTGTLTNSPVFNSSGVATFNFDGTDDYAITTGPNLTSQATFSCWFKTSSSQNNRYLMAMAKVLSSGNNGIDIYFEPTTIGSYLSTASSFANPKFTTNYYDGQWHMATVTFDGSNVRFYYDGILRVTSALSGSLSLDPVRNLTVGSWANGGVPVNAQIPIAQVYSLALSADQVLQNYNAQKGRFGLPTNVTNGLVAQLEAGNPSSYPGSGTIWYDISGNGNNFTLFNGASYDSTTKSMAFDGSDDYARSTNFIDLSSASATTVQWIGKQDTASQQFLWEHTPDWNSTPGGFGILMDSTGSGFQQGSWHANWYNQAARNFINLIQSTSNFFSQTHRLIPNNSLGLQDWVNTDLQTFVVGPGYPTGTSTVGNNNGFANNYTYLASRAGSSLLLDGNIGVFLMYNRALSQPEIVQNYEYYRSLYGLTGVTRNGLVLWLDAGNNQSYPTQGTTWYDISGSVFDARLLNSPTYSSDGRGSILFDGTNDIGEISLGNIPTGTQARTISVWVKYVAYGSDYYSICGYGDESSSRTFDIGIINSTQRIFLDVYGAGGIQTTNSVTPGTWFNVTGIYTGTQLKLYLNGSLETTNTFTINTASSTFKIADMAWSYPGLLNGNVGNVIFYNRALSDSEVTQNFNAQKNRYGL
jgi:hypothetical protein